jgi:hypothetical protein
VAEYLIGKKVEHVLSRNKKTGIVVGKSWAISKTSGEHSRTKALVRWENGVIEKEFSCFLKELKETASSSIKSIW